MDKSSTFVIVGLILLGVGFFVVLKFFDGTIFGGRDVRTETPPAVGTEPPSMNENGMPTTVTVTPKTVVTAKHAYRSGAHIIAGEIPLPTPCHLLEATGTASEDKKSVLVEITSGIKTGDMCAQVITPARFKVSVRASQGATLSATLNGQAVTLNLIEAGADDDLENFDLYIKG